MRNHLHHQLLRGASGAALLCSLLCLAAVARACDFSPNLAALESSLSIDIRVQEDGCLLEETCLTGTGNRTLLRFSTQIDNVGSSDCVLGAAPPCPPDGPVLVDPLPYVWSPCHKHWHYTGYAKYSLNSISLRDGKRLRKAEVLVGVKNGFCLMDLECDNGVKPKYTCSNQGVSLGCRDVYRHYLACQWLDITDIPGLARDASGWPQGAYEVCIELNVGRGIAESDYSNNVACTMVDLGSLLPYEIKGKGQLNWFINHPQNTCNWSNDTKTTGSG